MPNTFITPDIVAKEAILALENEMVMAGLVYRNFDSDFDGAVGDTITVRKPATFHVDEWATDIQTQSISEGSTTVKLDTIPDISVVLTAKERALELKDFSNQVVRPAMRALAQYFDEKLLGLATDIPYSSAVGATPAIADIADVRKVAVLNKMPASERYMVLDPTTTAKYLVLPAILNAEKSGSTSALREASIGRILGFDSFESQNVASHANGSATAGKATGTEGDETIAVGTLSAATATITKGTLFTIADDTTVYTVTENATGVTSAIAALKIYPTLQKTAAGKDMTFIADHVANVAFHRNCFVLATRTLPTPMGGNSSAVANLNGIGIRVVYGYDISKKADTISFDCLYGCKTLTPELGVRFTG